MALAEAVEEPDPVALALALVEEGADELEAAADELLDEDARVALSLPHELAALVQSVWPWRSLGWAAMHWSKVARQTK